MKKLVSVLLALVMMLAMLPVQVFAAASYTVLSVDKTQVSIGEDVHVTVTLPNIENAGNFDVRLLFDKDLFTVKSRTTPAKVKYYDESVYDDDSKRPTFNDAATANGSGKLTANLACDFNTLKLDGVVVIDAILTAKAAGTANFSFELFKIADQSTTFVSTADLATLPSVTILKAPLTSASVSLGAPVKGQTLDSASTEANAYSVTSTEWYEGNTASGITVSGAAKANQVYTAKVTLTAVQGESFADSVSVTVNNDAAKSIAKNSDGTLTVTKTFNKTADKDATTVTWKINDPIEKTYNGSAQEAAESAASTVTVNRSNGECSFRYYTNSGCTTLTSVAGSGAAAEGGAPKNAGTYWVKVEVAADDYNKAAVSEARQFTIAKANASCTAPTGITGLTYTGSAQALVTAGTPTGGDMVYSTAQNGTYEKTIPTGTNAGSYTVWYKVKGDDNHKDTAAASVAVSIGKKTVSTMVTAAKNIVVSATGSIALADLTYNTLPSDFDATSCKLTAVVTDSSVVENASVGATSVTLKSDLAAGNTQSLSVKLTSDNYNDVTATVTLTVVNKEMATVKVTGAPASAKTYGDAAFNLGVTCNPSGMPCTWSSSNTNVLTVNDGKVTIKGVGTATITATCEDDNYVGSNSVTITVNAKSVTITGLGAANKEYDGDATATVTGTAVLTGKVGGDDVTVSGGSAAFADKNVGTGKNVTFSDYSLSGKDAGNYILSAQPVSVKANITAKTLTVSGVTPSADVTKVYDGGTTVDQTFTLGLTGVVEGETVNAKYTSAAYNNKTVGNSKTVTLSGITLDGATAGNYTVAKTATTTGAITAKSVTITGLSAADKVYDGKTNATVTGTAVVTDKVSGDTVTVSGGSAAFADKNVGTGKNVTFSGYSLSGKDAGNYTLSAQPATVTANITAKTLTITGVSATSRSYVEDNTAVDLTGGSLVGVVSGDTVNFTLGSGSIESANAGNRKAVTTNITLTGADKDNYTLTQPTVTVTISKAAAPAAPSVTGVNCTTSAQNNGKITGVNSTMEYKLSTASVWTKVTGTEITGLVPGEYEIRVAETNNVLAGKAAEVTIVKHGCVFTAYTYNDDATCAKNGTETAHCTGEGCKATNTREKAGTMTAHEYVNGVCKNCQAVNPVGTTLSKKTVTSVEKVTALVSAGKIAVEEGKSEALVQAIRDDKLTTKNKVKTISTPANATAFVNKATDVVSRDSSMKNAQVMDYLDISVVLLANGTELGSINETDRPVTFQIKLDEQLAASLAGKKVFVLREHGSEITKLAATLSAGILTFSSDKFSTYAIVAYEPVSGGNHHGGSYNPGHTVTSDLGNVTRVTVDGKVVDSKYYTVSGGNVVLSGEFMKTLTNGKHTVKLYNGSIAATGVITVTGNTVQAPRTGDAGAVLYGVMAISSVLGMGWVAKKKRCEK